MRTRPLIGVTLDSEPAGGWSRLPWYALRQNYFDAVIGLTCAMGQPLKMPQTAVYSGVADADAPRLIKGDAAGEIEGADWDAVKEAFADRLA